LVHAGINGEWEGDRNSTLNFFWPAFPGVP